MIQYKNELFDVFRQLIEHAKNERGFSGAGRVLMRLLHNIGGVYTAEERFVNEDEWESSSAFACSCSALVHRPSFIKHFLRNIFYIGVSYTTPNPLR